MSVKTSEIEENFLKKLGLFLRTFTRSRFLSQNHSKLFSQNQPGSFIYYINLVYEV